MTEYTMEQMCEKCGSKNVTPSFSIPMFRCNECGHVTKDKTPLELIHELFNTGYYDWVKTGHHENTEYYLIDADKALTISQILNNILSQKVIEE